MTDAPNSMPVHCGTCRHEWFAFKSPIPIFVAAKLAANMRCPKCNGSSDRIYCGPVINTSAERVNEIGES
jgi:hypothetical protein